MKIRKVDPANYDQTRQLGNHRKTTSKIKDACITKAALFNKLLQDACLSRPMSMCATAGGTLIWLRFFSAFQILNDTWQSLTQSLASKHSENIMSNLSFLVILQSTKEKKVLLHCQRQPGAFHHLDYKHPYCSFYPKLHPS